jgi:hypothetical protein
MTSAPDVFDRLDSRANSGADGDEETPSPARIGHLVQARDYKPKPAAAPTAPVAPCRSSRRRGVATARCGITGAWCMEAQACPEWREAAKAEAAAATPKVEEKECKKRPRGKRTMFRKRKK